MVVETMANRTYNREWKKHNYKSRDPTSYKMRLVYMISIQNEISYWKTKKESFHKTIKSQRNVFQNKSSKKYFKKHLATLIIFRKLDIIIEAVSIVRKTLWAFLSYF